jgi:hypothetical protein
MSKVIQNTASGTQDVRNTAKSQRLSEAATEWAMTVALQKTEWHSLKGVKTRLLSLTDAKSGRKFVAAVWAIPTEDLTADNEKFTFFVSGTDVDDIVAQMGEK